jgi:hypothetical protein
MWITTNGEQILNRICNNINLTKEELNAVTTYNGFRDAKKLNISSPGSPLIYEIQDILKKYDNYTDPLEE